MPVHHVGLHAKLLSLYLPDILIGFWNGCEYKVLTAHQSMNGLPL